MDSESNSFSNSHRGFDLNVESVCASSHQYPPFKTRYKSLDLNLMDFPSPETVSPAASLPPPTPPIPTPAVDLPNVGVFSDTVFDYMGQMLREEEMEEKSCMFHDPLAQQAAEKSFYETLAGQTPFFPDPNSNFSSNYGWNSGEKPIGDLQVDYKHPSLQSSFLPLDSPFHVLSQAPYSYPSSSSSSSHNRESLFQLNRKVEGINKLHECQSQCRRKLDETTKFLHCEIPGNMKESEEGPVKVEKCERVYWVNGERRSKQRLMNYIGIEEGRRSKQLELSEMFDRVLQEKNAEPLIFHAGCGGGRKQEQVKEAVDLRALLLLCARAVSSDDRKAADELLKQIVQHSSPFGDGSERFAYYFANGLMARMGGTGVQIYTSWASKNASAADMLKAYQVYLLNCPYIRFSIYFANHHILNLAENARTLHIIDFGILYGVQWPMVIERLLRRPGGPPKLRITGIELPQPGLRPMERVKQTGLHLTEYCERFNMPFEYNAIAKKWETIKLEDLKIGRDEKIAVNCLFRFKTLLDETVLVNSPRTAVLKLIRKINPDIFTHSVVNGSYSSPFFVTRFREAIFHFSSLFDMFDAIFVRRNQERLMFEREFYGREAMNVIACEDSERVERPESYKQWQVRHKNVGFKQLPLDRELIKTVKDMVKDGYHKDFVVDEDGSWMLQGWKGRIFCASCCWIPAPGS